MSDTLSRLVVELGANPQKLVSGLGDADKHVKGFADRSGSALSGLGRHLGDVGRIAGGFVLGQGLMAAPGIFADLGQQSAQLALQLNKANTVFGDQIGVVQAWASANAASMGLTRSEATNLAAGMADLLVPMGMTREAATAMSTKTIGLAGALAEWSGGQRSAAEVAEILSGAMLGEFDALKGLGIGLGAADVQQRLVEKGQQNLTGAALQQAQALATQELILEKSTDAQAAFADGAGSAARKQAESTAKMREAKEVLANGLAPAYQAVMGVVASAMPLLTAFAGRVVETLQGMDWSGVQAGAAAFVGVITTQILPAVQQLASWVTEQLVPALVDFWQGDVLPKFEAFAGVMTGAVIPAVTELAQVIAGRLGPAVQGTIGFIADHKEVLAGFGIAVAALVVPAFAAWAISAGAAAIATIAATAPVIAIGVGVAALATGLILLVKNWDDVTDAVKRAPEGLVIVKDAIVDFATNTIPEVASRLAELGGQFASWVADAVPPMLSALGGLAGDLVSWIGETAPKVGAQLLEWGAQFVQWAIDAVPPLLLELAKLWVEVHAWILTTAAQIGVQLAQWAGQFLAWVVPMIPGFVLELGKIWVGLHAWVVEKAAEIGTSLVTEWVPKFLGWIKDDLLPKLPPALGEIITKIAAWVTGAAREVAAATAGIGAAMLQGIRDGVTAGWDALVSWLRSKWDSLPKPSLDPRDWFKVAGGGGEGGDGGQSSSEERLQPLFNTPDTPIVSAEQNQRTIYEQAVRATYWDDILARAGLVVQRTSDGLAMLDGLWPQVTEAGSQAAGSLFVLSEAARTMAVSAGFMAPQGSTGQQDSEGGAGNIPWEGITNAFSMLGVNATKVMLRSGVAKMDLHDLGVSLFNDFSLAALAEVLHVPVENIERYIRERNAGIAAGIPTGHADGGIFTRPMTLMANDGSMHSFGEAGPEALVPLDRWTAGKFGLFGRPGEQQPIINVYITGDNYGHTQDFDRRVTKAVVEAVRGGGLREITQGGKGG
jgi:hypothetical protein